MVSRETFAQLSEDEIQQRIKSIESDKAALQKALESRRQQSKKELASEVREMIVSRGYEVADIVGILAAKKRGAARGKSSRAYTRYVDPDNPDNVYVRGVLPGWMKEKMAANGLNPKSKDDRETFKAKFLERTDG